jgi:hypothetical protein
MSKKLYADCKLGTIRWDRGFDDALQILAPIIVEKSEKIISEILEKDLTESDKITKLIQTFKTLIIEKGEHHG